MNEVSGSAHHHCPLQLQDPFLPLSSSGALQWVQECVVTGAEVGRDGNSEADAYGICYSQSLPSFNSQVYGL